MLLIYDGECGFCVRSARWIAARLPEDVRVEPWQSLELGRLGLSQRQAEASVWWMDDAGSNPQRCHGAEAIGRALAASRGVWRVPGHVMSRPPLLWLARPIYSVVAANRHRLPGPR